jgi:hypothetical protein
LQELYRLGFTGRYDFFYLPMDVHNRTNVGYAFINFLTPQDALQFTRSLTNYKFQRHASQKIATVSPAHIQGLVNNLYHFSNRAVSQSLDIQYRPIVIRNGCYRDCSEVLNEMISEAERGTKSAPQFCGQQPPKSNLNPDAQVFVPNFGADFLNASDCQTAEARLAPGLPLTMSPQMSEKPLSYLWPSQHDMASKPCPERFDDTGFGHVVLNLIQKEDSAQYFHDTLDMASTEDGSRSYSSGGATPTTTSKHSKLGASMTSPASAQSSDRSLEGSSDLSPRTSRMLLGSFLWDASTTLA